jgi:hypothetical protein
VVEKAKPQVPENRNPKDEVAAAAQQAIEQVKKGALAGVTEDDLIWNDPEVEVVKGNQYHCDSWVHAPANIELLSSAYKLLLKTSKTTAVAKVRVARVKGTKYIIIKATDPNDPNGIEVKLKESSAFINAVSVLGPARLSVRSGYKDRFVVELAPDDFPGAPALLIHLGKRVERVLKAKKGTIGVTGPGKVAPASEGKVVDMDPNELQFFDPRQAKAKSAPGT